MNLVGLIIALLGVLQEALERSLLCLWNFT